MPATCQNLPTLNSLPYFEFNEFAPKSPYYEEEAPQNSGLLIPKSVLFKKKIALWFLIYYLCIQVIPVRFGEAEGGSLLPELKSRGLFRLF